MGLDARFQVSEVCKCRWVTKESTQLPVGAETQLGVCAVMGGRPEPMSGGGGTTDDVPLNARLKAGQRGSRRLPAPTGLVQRGGGGGCPESVQRRRTRTTRCRSKRAEHRRVFQPEKQTRLSTPTLPLPPAPWVTEPSTPTHPIFMPTRQGLGAVCRLPPPHWRLDFHRARSRLHEPSDPLCRVARRPWQAPSRWRR